MKRFALVIGLLMLFERVWKHWMVACFFRRPIPRSVVDPLLISILQPVLSGDPTMSACLERSLQLKSRYRLEFIWIADRDDPAGQQICRELIERYPERSVQLLTVPPALESENPKVAKLIEGVKVARGET